MFSIRTSFFVILTLVISSGFVNLFQRHPQKSLYVITGQAQGTTYTIKYIHTSPIVEKSAIQKILAEIDQSLSLYRPTSLISQFNQSNRGIKADLHLLRVVQNSLLISNATHGCFDITAKPFSMLWGFDAAMPKSIPSRALIQQTRKEVGSHHLSFIKDTLNKDNAKTKIDCDGVAQGYTVDQLSLLLRNLGITDFLVELGGEVFASGKNLSGNDWIIGIEGSEVYTDDNHFIEKKISLTNMAVTTSGSMKKFRKMGDRYWSHVIDPRTGLPVDNGIVSVTVIGKDAMTADAYDNGFMVMGIHSSLLLANQSKDLGLYIVYVKADGSLSDTANAIFKHYLINQ